MVEAYDIRLGVVNILELLFIYLFYIGKWFLSCLFIFFNFKVILKF